MTQLFRAPVFVKTGADGVYCSALPEPGFGIAIKWDDGAGRAAQAVVTAIIARFLPNRSAEQAAPAAFARPLLRKWNGIEVGALQMNYAL